MSEVAITDSTDGKLMPLRNKHDSYAIIQFFICIYNTFDPDCNLPNWGAMKTGQFLSDDPLSINKMN